jgi:hypothetical protein
LAKRLGVAGSVLGVLAGVAQTSIGSRIPEWTGNKLQPGPLGLLTILLSLIAGAAAVRQAASLRSTGFRTACALAMIGPGLLCLSTVGRLWYVPGLLLLLAGAVSIDNWLDVAALVARNWLRCLLGLLGLAELLMAAGSAPLTLVLGLLGGVALLAAAWLAPPRKATAALLLGTVPFTALAWTAVVPVLLLVVAIAIAAALAGRPSTRSSAHA